MFKAILKRTSIRNYEIMGLTKNDLKKVTTVLANANTRIGPFGHKARFFYTENKKDGGGVYGTYGFIKNPPAFVGGVISNTKEALVDFGYLFEEIILHLTELHLGTVWLGGSFNRNEFDIEVKKNEIIAAISPVGYPQNRSIRERIIRTFVQANKRKDFEELFFIGKNLTPVTKNHLYSKYLQAVQMGPSASNKQPWRIILEKDCFHLFLRRTPGYGNPLKFDIQAIDIGIALAHLELTLKEDLYSTSIVMDKPFDIKGLEYIISIKIKTQLDK